MEHMEYAKSLCEAAEFLQKNHPELPDVVATYKKSADVIESLLVVRCKDCRYSCISAWKYWCDNRNAPFYMGRSIQVEADDFCSYGKRRDNNA